MRRLLIASAAGLSLIVLSGSRQRETLGTGGVMRRFRNHLLHLTESTPVTVARDAHSSPIPSHARPPPEAENTGKVRWRSATGGLGFRRL